MIYYKLICSIKKKTPCINVIGQNCLMLNKTQCWADTPTHATVKNVQCLTDHSSNSVHCLRRQWTLLDEWSQTRQLIITGYTSCSLAFFERKYTNQRLDEIKCTTCLSFIQENVDSNLLNLVKYYLNAAYRTYSIDSYMTTMANCV